MAIINAIHRLALAFWIGGAAMFTFVVTPILFRTEGRDVAARIVGALFPAYFRWGLVCGLVSLVCLLVIRGRHFTVALALLVVMLTATSWQAFYVEPRAAALKREIGSFESTSKEHPLRKEFAKLHGISAACNIAVITGGIVLIVLL